MSKVIVTESHLEDIADAIREKLGVATTYRPGDMAAAIESISGGGGSVISDVNFRDYDGTIVQSYSAAEFLALTAMPANPSHEGLTAQGWNWTLSDAKTYVAEYGKLEIGQMYITTDGKTHIYIHLEQGRTSPMLGCCPDGTVDVDWGDGTAHDTLTGTSTSTVIWTSNHNYTVPGDYVIKLAVTGRMEFFGGTIGSNGSGLLRYVSSDDNRNYAYRNAIRSVNVGNGVTSISEYAFSYCWLLESITLHNNITIIDQNAFLQCEVLTSVTIPDGTSSIERYAFSGCDNIMSVTIPKSVTGIDFQAFAGITDLVSITIPDGASGLGGQAFKGCTHLVSVVIPNSVTFIGSQDFNNCRRLESITIPNNATIIRDKAFTGCSRLASIAISDSVTNIGMYVFSGCINLASITIPDSVTDIGDYAFEGCYSLAELHLAPTIPPTTYSNVLRNTPDDLIIYVPYSADHSILEAYKTASNWSAYASKMQEETA